MTANIWGHMTWFGCACTENTCMLLCEHKHRIQHSFSHIERTKLSQLFCNLCFMANRRSQLHQTKCQTVNTLLRLRETHTSSQKLKNTYGKSTHCSIKAPRVVLDSVAALPFLGNQFSWTVSEGRTYTTAQRTSSELDWNRRGSVGCYLWYTTSESESCTICSPFRWHILKILLEMKPEKEKSSLLQLTQTLDFIKVKRLWGSVSH